MINIVFLDAATMGPEISFDAFKTLGNFIKYDETNSDQILERIKYADVIVTNKSRINTDIMRQCEKLKLICVAATGINNIDADYAAEASIQVKNVAGYSTNSVVQLTYGILLSLVMRLNYYDDFVKSGEYTNSGFFTGFGYCFSELSGKQIGIIGMGNIGNSSAAIGIAFGAKVVYYSTSGNNNSAPYPRLELDELLKTSDFVLIHAPLNDKTRNLINADKIKLMKPSAIIVNTGRGPIVNEADIAFAVDNGIIAAAGTDVFSVEPIKADNPFLAMKHPERILLTPHIAWTSLEARQRLVAGVAENIKSFLNA